MAEAMAALQIPDTLAKQIHEIAEVIGVSVPEMLGRMLADYQRRNRRILQRPSAITERLDAVYAIRSSTLDTALLKMQKKSLSLDKK